LSSIELKQQQLEEQDRLLSEAFDFPKLANRKVQDDSLPRSVNYATDGSLPVPQLSQQQLSGQDVILPGTVLPESCFSIKPAQNKLYDMQKDAFHYPESSHVFNERFHPSSVYCSSSGAPVTTGAAMSQAACATPLANALSKNLSELQPQVDISGMDSRIRDYQSRLLHGQTNRQQALLEARRRLQERTNQLLGETPVLTATSRVNAQEIPTCFHSQKADFSVPLPSSSLNNPKAGEQQVDVDAQSSVSSSDFAQTGLANYRASNYAEGGRQAVSFSPSSDRTTSSSSSVSQKEYHPLQYATRSDAHKEYSQTREFGVVDLASRDSFQKHDGELSSTAEHDDRDFVTPEMRPDGRLRACRPVEQSPTNLHAATLEVSCARVISSASDVVSSQAGNASQAGNVLFGDDDFNTRVLMAQRELELRQQRMQEQLTALENEERLLVEEQRRIEEQLGNFRAFPDISYCLMGEQKPSNMKASIRQNAHVEDRLLDEDCSSGRWLSAASIQPLQTVTVSPPTVSVENVTGAMKSASKSGLTLSSVINNEQLMSQTDQCRFISAEETSPYATEILPKSGPISRDAVSDEQVKSQINYHNSSSSSLQSDSCASAERDEKNDCISDTDESDKDRNDKRASMKSTLRKPVHLDPYASSHSDLLALLADGNLPSLSGPASPCSSWNNASIHNLLLDDSSARRDVSSYHLLPEAQPEQTEVRSPSDARKLMVTEGVCRSFQPSCSDNASASKYESLQMISEELSPRGSELDEEISPVKSDVTT
jgi:hypothetical protein